MSRQVTFVKDFRGHKKGEVAHLREREFSEALSAKAVSVSTGLVASETETKSSKPAAPVAPPAPKASAPNVKPSDESSSDGSSQSLRPHNTSRR